ncbi:MAG TPA: tetratricopeptide repeat protein [Dongiaceae bacterium]|jgi:lipoprotein NlpI|nr:tetratricopeptide repeat protein [Dongiaceae bacterium]
MALKTQALIAAILAAAAGAAQADGSSELYACYDALNSGDNAAAIVACDRAIESGDLSDDALAVAFTRRSIADRNLQRYDDALADCTRAVAHRADDRAAQFACGNAHGSKGDYAAALQSFGRAIALGPDQPDAYNGRGNIYNQTGDFTRALADVDAALHLSPHYVWAQINRGIALFGLSRFAEAADEFDAAASSDPQNAYAVLWSVIAHSRAGEDAHMNLVASVLVLDLDVWPGPIVKDYQLELAPLAPVISPERPAVALEPRPGEQCETVFYDAELDLLKGKPDIAKPKLQEAADTCPKTYIEHAAALAELRRLSGPE